MSQKSNNTSHSSVEFQRKVRVERMNELKNLGVNPFEVQSFRAMNLAELAAEFNVLTDSPQISDQARDDNASTTSKSSVTLAGRIKSKRVSGKIAFATIEDESYPDGFQFIFRRDFLPQYEDDQQLPGSSLAADGTIQTSLSFKHFKSLIDEGDYIQAEGYLDRSQRGEPSLFVQKYTILTKALRPLPEELEYDNLEERYTNRVVDYKMNTVDTDGVSVREVVKKKALYWQIWREEMLKEGFTEVYNPIFEHIPGGAEAKPFTTFYNELDQEMFMRISLELPLKKLISGGFESVFEIGRIFRNESASPQHLQEYTQIEWYKAYTDYDWAATFSKRVYQRLAQEIAGDLIQTDYYGNQINWGEWCSTELAAQRGWELVGGWPKIPFYDAVRYFSDGKIDVENKTAEELVQLAQAHGVEDVSAGLGMSTLMDKLWKVARQNTTNPFFLVLPPAELEPLAKRDPRKPELVQRWQIVAGRAEHGKAFSELNDPIDQFGRFEEQQAARDAGNEEAQFMDEDYVRALEYGLPPLSGFGVSERLFSFLLGKHIKECSTFPYVKRIEEESRKKKTMVAHAIILQNAAQPLWSQMNAAAHLSASFAARAGAKLVDINTSHSQDGVEIPMNIQHAILMKSAQTSDQLRTLRDAADKNHLDVTVFTADMRNSSNDKKVTMAHSQKPDADIEYLGVLIFGKKSDVEQLTDAFEMIGEG